MSQLIGIMSDVSHLHNLKNGSSGSKRKQFSLSMQWNKLSSTQTEMHLITFYSRVILLNIENGRDGQIKVDIEVDINYIDFFDPQNLKIVFGVKNCYKTLNKFKELIPFESLL